VTGRRIARDVCTRCAEPQIEQPRYGLCVWCEEELLRRSLKTAAAEVVNPSKVAAIDWIRRHGYSAEQLQMARAAVRAGADVEEAAQGLEACRDEAVAA